LERVWKEVILDAILAFHEGIENNHKNETSVRSVGTLAEIQAEYFLKLSVTIMPTHSMKPCCCV
jgi:hypothetical protein